MAYDEVKTAQAAARLLRRAGGRMPFLKLIKLLYLAERRSLQQFGYPLTGDRLVSMRHGPVLSRTYDHIKGDEFSAEGGWDAWIADQADYMVGLTEHGSTGNFDDLSESDIDALDATWLDFGAMGKWELRDYTHTLPEWEDPGDSMKLINMGKLLSSLGYSKEAAGHLLEQFRQHKAIDRHFA